VSSIVRVQVQVNGESRTIPPGCTVTGLVASLDLDHRRVAVAINHDVVPRSSFDAHVLTPGDRIEILEAVGGG
jgi:sulfur carrier protein